MRNLSRGAIAVASLVLAGALTACGGSSGSSGDVIKIGASIPLTGGLASFGAFEKWGYQHAVDAVNASGGISIDGKKRKVQLTILDDQTDPNRTVNNMTRL